MTCLIQLVDFIFLDVILVCNCKAGALGMLLQFPKVVLYLAAKDVVLLVIHMVHYIAYYMFKCLSLFLLFTSRLMQISYI
jgi:hypothetical protein